MGYQDHISASSSQRPTCWGNERSYDPNDIECSECKFRHSCRAQIDRGEAVPINRSYTPSSNYRRQRDDSVDAGVNESGMVGPNERPVERFAKDAFAGALRGMFYEMYSFWKRYRIR